VRNGGRMLMVTGANGRFAQATIRELRQLVGADEPIAVTTRDPRSPAAVRLAAEGIDVREGDFDDPDSLVDAFAGVRKAVIVSTMAANDQRFRLHANAVDAAQRSGVRHLVYTSFINAGPEAITEHSRLVHFPTEQKLKSSGLDWTILRHSLYAETLLDDLDRTLASGVFTRPGGRVPAAYIAREDLGRSAARVLAEDGHEGRTYSETMTSALTGEEIAAALSEAAGRPIRYEPMPSAAWPTYFASVLGLPVAMVGSAEHTMRALEAGELDLVTADYASVTGRQPTTIEEFLRTRVPRGPMR
ncbi:MAG: NmrA family NAD(P)-binding protein, partial [Microbacteriaceae bacterium]|nr:NmrA family NAD(P)-binding protein [Microbacteriaceae bacterium]